MRPHHLVQHGGRDMAIQFHHPLDDGQHDEARVVILVFHVVRSFMRRTSSAQSIMSRAC